LCPKAVYASTRLKIKVKKYGLFQELFFVERQRFNPDLAICNKRFVRRIHRLVIKRGDGR
jgi:hypothetical protein